MSQIADTPQVEPTARNERSEPRRSVGQGICRPIHRIRRRALTPASARTDLERYKLSLRKYAPADRGLPWHCQSHCVRCDAVVPASFLYSARKDAVELELRCPNCGTYRQHHHDALFSPPRRTHTPYQPERTLTGTAIRETIGGLPKTVETLCPECSCILLGRYYVQDNVVLIEKTCPEHGYFRDKINTDVRLYLKATRSIFQDERGVCDPQVTGARSCPTDCGLCNQHISTSCLPQIDLTNRCNLNCPICFANAGKAGYVAEPSFQLVVEMLQALREQHPVPATAIQLTGGEPTVRPDFHRIVAKAIDLGFTHVQVATNGIKFADPAYARRSAEVGVHTLYLQFDGVGDEVYLRTRGARLYDRKVACIENCGQVDIKVVLVPTVIKGFNDDQVGRIFRFAVEHIEAICGIAYQPVVFTGRISPEQRESMRYTLGDLAHDIARVSGADLMRDFLPLSFITPISNAKQMLDGRPKIRPSCHCDCAFGTYFFVTPDCRAIPMPKLFDVERLFAGMNRIAMEALTRRGKGNLADRLLLAWEFFKAYRWRNLDRRVMPWTFIGALQGLTDKAKGRGEAGKKRFRTLMAAGMHFMDRYNYDVERVKRCVIQYSTPDGIYPFCTINGGPTYRPFLEKMLSAVTSQAAADAPELPTGQARD